MTEQVDVYWSFRSPYSYLVTPDLLALKADFDVDVQLRVVLPLAMRNPSAVFDPSNRKPARYIMLDWQRRAEFLGLSASWPNPDPIVQDKETFRIADQQPYIHRLSALGVEARRRGRGIEFAREVSHLLFGGQGLWHQGDHLHRAAAAAGLDLDDMERATENGDHLAEVESNHASLDAAGHWGVPTMVVRDEPFFGQDRIDTLRWRLDQLGLGKKAA